MLTSFHALLNHKTQTFPFSPLTIITSIYSTIVTVALVTVVISILKAIFVTMGQLHSTMRDIEDNPPVDLAQATLQFLDKYGEVLKTLGPLEGTAVQEFYLNAATASGSAPCAILFGDLSTISLYAAQSGIQFVDFRALGPLALGKTVLANGNSGLGKSLLIKFIQARLRLWGALLKTDIFQHIARIEEASGDTRMTPCAPHSKTNFDKIHSVSCEWDPVAFEEFLVHHYKRGGIDDIPLVGNADRMKCLYQQIIKRLGWMVMQCPELEDKMQSLNEAGDKNAGQLIIQISDELIPARNYSTAKLSTPQIRGCRCSFLGGCTPQTLLEFLRKYGLKGAMRRLYCVHIPAYEKPVTTTIDDNYDENGDLIDHVAADFNVHLEAQRDFKFFKFLMKNPFAEPTEQKQDDFDELYFKRKIPVVNIGLMSSLERYKRIYKRDNAEDPELRYMQWPQRWVDESGNLKSDVYEVADVYLKIKRDQQQYQNSLSQAASIMLKERHIRVFTLAYILTVRKKMLEVKTATDEFVWDLELDYEMTKAAVAFIDIFDEYSFLLMNIPAKSGRSSNASPSSSNSNSNNSSQTADQVIILETNFKRLILKNLVAKANPTITSSVLTRTLYNKQAFAKLDNMMFIRQVVAVDFPELFECEQIESNNNNRKWMATIKRKRLSIVTASMTDTERLTLMMKLSGMGVNIQTWSAVFGPQEQQWARNNRVV